MLVLLLLFVNVLGQSVRFNQTVIDSPLEQVIWCGSSIVITGDDDTVQQDKNEQATHRKVLFVLSQNGVLYRSTDYGFNWRNVSEQIISNYSVKTDSGVGSNYYFSEILQSPADSNVLYFVGHNGSSFRSFDCGKNYLAFKHYANLTNFKMNKMDPKMMFAFQEKKCNRSSTLCKEKYKNDLLFSKDAGNTWKVILQRVRDASWDKLLQYLLVPDGRIIASHIADNGSYVVTYSDDYFVTHQVIRWFAFGYYQTPVYLFLLVKADAQSEGYDLEIAPSFSDTYRPTEIILPLDDKSKHTFTVLDTQDGQVFISVSHNEDIPKLTNIYVSDANGNKFTVSLLGNVRGQDSGNCDFEHIQGLEGVYISNIFDHSEVLKFQQRQRSITDEEASRVQALKFERLELYKKTMISFDKGGTWNKLKAPKYDVDGKLLNCAGDCALHLNGRTEALNNPIYSSDTAHGLIVATGNTGMYLSNRPEEVNTYLSRDGGHNWYEILAGSHTYEIGDYGGLIVMINHSKTNRVLYSWDQGQSFEKIVFSDQFKIDVDNIITEPFSNMEQKFLVIGRQDSQLLGLREDEEDIYSRSLKGVIIALDFTSLHQMTCTGIQNPGYNILFVYTLIRMPESDYEFWTPMNFIGDKCLFGRSVKYLRRKRKSKCFNPETMDQSAIIETCPCTQDDWECELGYERRFGQKDCIPQIFSEVDQVPKICKGNYTKNQGYKIIPGNQCRGGLYLGPLEVECPIVEEVEKPNIQDLTTEIPKSNHKVNRVQEEQLIEEPSLHKPTQSIKQNTKINENTKIYENMEKHQLDNNINKIILFIMVLVIVYLMKGRIIEMCTKSNESKQVKKKSYYPKNEEEMDSQRKSSNKNEQVALFKDDDDEESGL